MGRSIFLKKIHLERIQFFICGGIQFVEFLAEITLENERFIRASRDGFQTIQFRFGREVIGSVGSGAALSSA